MDNKHLIGEWYIYDNTRHGGWCILRDTQQGKEIMCVGGEVLLTGNANKAFTPMDDLGSYYFSTREKAQNELDHYFLMREIRDQRLASESEPEKWITNI